MEGCRLDSENLRSAWFEFEGDRLLARRADTGRNARERSLRGELDAPTLSWLDETLGASATRPTLAYTDAARFRNSDALAAVLGRHQRVLLVAAGHVHRLAVRRAGNS